MDKIWTIAWNMVKRMIGSRRGVLVYLVLPTVVTAVIISMTSGVTNSKATILYVNQDEGAGGKHLLTELSATGDYELETVADEAALKKSITDQKGAAGLYIPANYSNGLLAGAQPQISVYELKVSEDSVLLKMKAATLSQEMRQAAAMAAAGGEAADAGARFQALLTQAEAHNIGSTRTDYDLYPREELGVVTGMTLMFLMGLVTTTVSMIMKDRKGRTMMRMFSAPVRAYEIALGNFLGSFFVGIIQIAAVLGLGKGLLHYDYEVPLYLYFLVLVAFILVSMGIASTVAGLVRNPNNAGMLNSLILTPTCMLGGCFWPLSIMPGYMQKVANFVPQKWAIQAVDIAASGGTWAELWRPFAILGLMAAVLLVIGSAILRPSEAGINA
ncbi:ABC transporter permease [Paenibacillus sp. NFR01]|uniref:ABC transporter permease n=1 Tax=Paenibacillus sp. NFR01 TaxID=1566279 RepID=UPI0008D610AD|nr:ABC transporter permease [Paenibacillus sp. NFR01]SEU14972.1 ABC-2 type transport system permease protein [Paenibacillus sp. NFR01]